MNRRPPSRPCALAARLTFLLLAILVAAPAGAGELRDPLPAVLAEAEPGALIPVSVVMKEQVGGDELRDLAARAADRAERRRLVTGRLKRFAAQSQQPVVAILSVEQAAGRVERLRPLWLSNVIGFDATKDVIERIAALPQVAWVNHNPKTDVFLGGPRDRCVDPHGTAGPWAGRAFAPAGGPILPFAPAAIESTTGPCAPGSIVECGVNLMRAPQVWDEFANTGGGIVVAVIDTGVCYTHPDIRNQIWVNPGEDLNGDRAVMDPADVDGTDNDGNGFVDDLIGWNFDLNNRDPNDSDSHGSHVAGTVAGDGTSGRCSGMAPDAQIMVLRVGVTFADEVDVWNAMQYAADNAADLISMSLGWPHSQNPDRATWRSNSDNVTAAGTTMIVAAGNEGSGNEPDNVRTPGDVPVVIGVGATNCSDVAASFSSRGPVTWQNVPPYNDWPYPPGLIKPEVSAPGVSTESHNFCSGYSFKSGTSMATPHVAGAAALVLSADPTLSRDELHEALANNSVDLGAPGKDNTYGAGRVDVYESVRAVAGRIRYASHRLDDANPDHGNSDGEVDIGETITLPVTVENRGTAAATGVHGFLSTQTAGITVLNNYATWPALAAGAQAETDAPHFTFRVNSACGATIAFRLEVRADDGSFSVSLFTVRVGTHEPVTYFEDDFETNKGWTTSATATAGLWVREDPHGTTLGGQQAQPEDDTTPSPGTACWVTGNPVLTGSQTAKAGDVDTGTVTLVSPTIDASGADTLSLDLNRWFARLEPANFDISSMKIGISSNNGATYSDMEALTANQNAWTFRSFNVLSFVGATAQMRIRVQASEVFSFATIGADTLIEALIDDVRLHGTRIVCESFSPPSLQPPNAVGETLRAEPSATHVRLTWTPPPTDATHGPATLYRVFRSEAPDGGFIEIGAPTSPLFVDKDAAAGPPNGHYKVRAENSGGQSNE